MTQSEMLQDILAAERERPNLGKSVGDDLSKVMKQFEGMSDGCLSQKQKVRKFKDRVDSIRDEYESHVAGKTKECTEHSHAEEFLHKLVRLLDAESGCTDGDTL